MTSEVRRIRRWASLSSTQSFFEFFNFLVKWGLWGIFLADGESNDRKCILNNNPSIHEWIRGWTSRLKCAERDGRTRRTCIVEWKLQLLFNYHQPSALVLHHRYGTELVVTCNILLYYDLDVRSPWLLPKEANTTKKDENPAFLLGCFLLLKRLCGRPDTNAREAEGSEEKLEHIGLSLHIQ